MKTNPSKPTAAPLVQIRPNPTRCRTRITDPDDASALRRLDCRLYDRCLGFAADRDWRGFHCNGCTAYQAPTDAERRRDHIAIMFMLEETQLLPSLLDPDAVTDEDQDEEDGELRAGAPRQRGFAPDPDDLDLGLTAGIA